MILHVISCHDVTVSFGSSLVLLNTKFSQSSILLAPQLMVTYHVRNSFLFTCLQSSETNSGQLNNKAAEFFSNHGYFFPFSFSPCALCHVPCWSFHLNSTNCVMTTYSCSVLLPSPSLSLLPPPFLPPSLSFPLPPPFLPPSLSFPLPSLPSLQSLREAIQYEPEIKHDKHIISFSLYELAMIHINRDEVGTLPVVHM